MTYEQLKDTLQEIVSVFFSDATVIWAEQKTVQPKVPYITLKLGGLTRDNFISESKSGDNYYNNSTTLEINLYTQGRMVNNGNKASKSYINTAISDLNDLFFFLDSDFGLDLQAEKKITISLTPPIRDLSELQHETSYRYRAMAEATVTFAQTANGIYGMYERPVPNASGGGNIEMATTNVETIEKAIITEGGNNNEE